MSTGVCVINRHGVALAADSAGTLFTDDSKMINNSMNKVFSLSRKRPIGAITYDYSVLNNIGIKQILSEFREYYDSCNEVDHLNDILNEFFDFLMRNNDYYGFDKYAKEKCNSDIKVIIKENAPTIMNEINSKSESGKSYEDIVNEVNVFIENERIKYDTFECPDNYDISNYLEKEHKNQFINELSNDFPLMLDYQEIVDSFWNLTVYILNHITGLDKNVGLLIAGYGKEDSTPGFIHVSIFCVLSGNVKYKERKVFNVQKDGSLIAPLAQSDVIRTFNKGISFNFRKVICEKIDEMINNKITSLSKKLDNLPMAIVKKEFNDVDGIVKLILAEEEKNEETPICNSLNDLQLPDMAKLAESYVDMTIVRRYFGIDNYQQTVGGPIDVALISRSDGFVWVKRKTYFDREINPDYINRISK